jgi:hypothetical protein
LARGGNDFELIIADGAAAAEAELRRAFERVSQKALAEQLCELNASIGLSVPHLITTRFRMQKNRGHAEHVARLPAPAESNQSLQSAVQVASVSDF